MSYYPRWDALKGWFEKDLYSDNTSLLKMVANTYELVYTPDYEAFKALVLAFIEANAPKDKMSESAIWPPIESKP